DEVTLAEIPGRSVIAGAAIVVGVQLDETVSAVAKQVERQQAHLSAQLALDVGNNGRPALVVHHHRCRRGGMASSGSRRRLQFALLEQLQFGMKRGNPFFAGGILSGGEIVDQPEEYEGEHDDDEYGDG